MESATKRRSSRSRSARRACHEDRPTEVRTDERRMSKRRSKSRQKRSRRTSERRQPKGSSNSDTISVSNSIVDNGVDDEVDHKRRSRSRSRSTRRRTRTKNHRAKPGQNGTGVDIWFGGLSYLDSMFRDNYASSDEADEADEADEHDEIDEYDEQDEHGEQDHHIEQDNYGSENRRIGHDRTNDEAIGSGGYCLSPVDDSHLHDAILAGFCRPMNIHNKSPSASSESNSFADAIDDRDGDDDDIAADTNREKEDKENALPHLSFESYSTTQTAKVTNCSSAKRTLRSSLARMPLDEDGAFDGGNDAGSNDQHGMRSAYHAVAVLGQKPSTINQNIFNVPESHSQNTTRRYAESSLSLPHSSSTRPRLAHQNKAIAPKGGCGHSSLAHQPPFVASDGRDANDPRQELVEGREIAAIQSTSGIHHHPQEKHQHQHQHRQGRNSSVERTGLVQADMKNGNRPQALSLQADIDDALLDDFIEEFLTDEVVASSQLYRQQSSPPVQQLVWRITPPCTLSESDADQMAHEMCSARDAQSAAVATSTAEMNRNSNESKPPVQPPGHKAGHGGTTSMGQDILASFLTCAAPKSSIAQLAIWPKATGYSPPAPSLVPPLSRNAAGRLLKAKHGLETPIVPVYEEVARPEDLSGTKKDKQVELLINKLKITFQHVEHDDASSIALSDTDKSLTLNSSLISTQDAWMNQEVTWEDHSRMKTERLRNKIRRYKSIVISGIATRPSSHLVDLAVKRPFKEHGMMRPLRDATQGNSVRGFRFGANSTK